MANMIKTFERGFETDDLRGNERKVWFCLYNNLESFARFLTNNYTKRKDGDVLDFVIDMLDYTKECKRDIK